MCGLVGVAGNIGLSQRRAFKYMLLFDTVRGEHSTGVLSAFKEKGKPYFQTLKEVGTPDRLYQAYPDMFDNGVYDGNRNPFLLLGHNRFATQGAIDKEGAHPFKFPNLVGAHNGTVQQWSLKGFHGENKFKIDSQIIYSELSHTKGNIGKVWKELQGAAALTWWDRITHKLNFIRNDQRPLHVCFSNDKKTMYWASEPWMLLVALAKVNLKHTEVEEVAVNHHIQFTIDDGKAIRMSFAKIEPRPAYTYTAPKGKKKKQGKKSGFIRTTTGEWPISLVGSDISLYGQNLTRIKLIKKVENDKGVTSFLCQARSLEDEDEEPYDVHLNFQYSSLLKPELEDLIDKSLKDKLLYYLVETKNIFYTGNGKAFWYNSACIDPVQGETPPPKKSDVVTKVWKSPFNEILTKEMFSDHYFLCENCHANIFWEDRTRFKPISKDMCLCEECSELPFLSHYIC